MGTLGATRLLCLALVLALPAAAAGPAPALYFLKDGEIPVLGDGILNRTQPDGLEPSTRPVIVGTEDLPAAVFRSADEPHPGRLLGPLFVGLWTGPSLVVDGNITATMYIIEDDGTMTALGSAGQHLTVNESSIPDPTSLIPPDPTDPEAAAAYIAAQVLAGLLQPPRLLQLGFVDVEVPEGAELAVGFYLEAADGSSLPLPVGAAATIQYDGALMPSFVYAPWYAPDPEPTTTSSTTRTTTSGTSTETSTGGNPTLGPGTGSDESEDSPGFTMVALLAGLGAVVVLVRRRL